MFGPIRAHSIISMLMCRWNVDRFQMYIFVLHTSHVDGESNGGLTSPSSYVSVVFKNILHVARKITGQRF